MCWVLACRIPSLSLRVESRMMSGPMPRTIGVTELILRDAHQSLQATRMALEDMIPAWEDIDKVGYWSVECWGGATFDACIRFLNEDPWRHPSPRHQFLPPRRSRGISPRSFSPSLPQLPRFSGSAPPFARFICPVHPLGQHKAGLRFRPPMRLLGDYAKPGKQ